MYLLSYIRGDFVYCPVLLVLFILLLNCHIGQDLQNLSNICIDADGLQLNFLWANCLPLVDADVGGVWVLRRHLPERIFYNTGSIIYYT